MLATLVGLWLLLALVGGTATLAGCLLTRGFGLARSAGILRRRRYGSGPGRPTAWQRSGRCSPRRCDWATRTSGPGSTASQRLSSSLTTRA
jgi:hypothetical protein